jgi:SAM-dependent methyltransferase
MALYLENETDVFASGARVLHLAPEPALYRRLGREPRLDYTTGDLEGGALVDVQLDARKLPFADDSFDLVLCSHVLEHIHEDIQVAREFARVLRPAGQALIMVPVDYSLSDTYEDANMRTPESRLGAYGHRDHVRRYGRDVLARLRSAELDVIRIPYADSLPAETQRFFLLQDRSRLRGDDIYRCTPRAGRVSADL